MVTYRVHLWIVGEHFGPVELESADPRSALEEAKVFAASSGAPVWRAVEYTVAELDAEGHWRLVESG